MSAITKLSRETHRMLHKRLTWLFIALTAAGSVWFCLNTTGRTASDAFIIYPAQKSAFFGALIFSLLTLLQFHMDFKSHADVLVFTSTDPISHLLCRTLSLIFAAIGTTLIISVFTLPYALFKTGVYFQPATFLTAWYLIFLGALVFSVLLSSGFYMLTCSAQAALIIMAGLIMLSMLLQSMVTLNPSYLFYWVQTTAGSFSDLITNQFQIDMLLWNRLFCFLVSLGIWSLGLSSLRRYGRGLFASFIVNCGRLWVPVLLIAALSLSGVSYAIEPIFDDSKPIDMGGAMSSGTGIVSSFGDTQNVGNPALLLLEKTFDLNIDTDSRRLSGTAKYKLRNETGKVQNLPVQINTGLTIDKIKLNGKDISALRGDTGELSTLNLSIELPAEAAYEIEIRYSGRMQNDNSLLQRATYGIADGYVWLPSIGVSPSLDINVAENSSFSGTLFLDEKLEPIFPSGKLEKASLKNGMAEWHFTGNSGTQGTRLFAADYITRSFEAGGLNISFKYFRKHDKSVNEMNAVNVIKATIDYFTKAYGPLVYSKNLTMMELPAYVSGGFAGGNMSAMDETNFDAEGYLPTESLLPDQGGGIEVLVHEIAHQWWGLGTMPMPDGESCWSAEGITCYSSYSFMKQYFGEQYANERYVKVWEKGFDTYKNAFYMQHPEKLMKLSNKDRANIMASFQTMRLYNVMPLMMLKGEAELGGTEAFQKKLSALYKTHIMQPITYNDFLSVLGLTKEVLELA